MFDAVIDPNAPPRTCPACGYEAVPTTVFCARCGTLFSEIREIFEDLAQQTGRSADDIEADARQRYWQEP